MASRGIRAIQSMVILFSLNTLCNVTLKPVPTTGCEGSPDATQSYSTKASVPTKYTLNIVPDEGWKQEGASWEYILGNKNFIWSGVGIPGAGGGYDGGGVDSSVEDALKLSSDNRTVSFSVTKSMNPGTTIVAGITQASQFVRSEKPTLVPRAAEGEVDVTFKGKTPCAGPPTSTISISGNANIASSCKASQITAGPSAYKTYEVKSYMSSLLSTALPPHGLTGPFTLDAAAAIQSDIGIQDAKCTYTKQCDWFDCKDSKDADSGSIKSVQRWIAYGSVVNFNNYLNDLYESLYKASGITDLMSAKIVTTFFVNPKPDVTWQNIMGILAPFLAFVQAAIGPIAGTAAAIGSAAAGIGSSMLYGAQGAGTIGDLAAVADLRFDEFADIQSWIATYTQNASQMIEHTYNVLLGPETPSGAWTGSKYSSGNGLFGDGVFSNADVAQASTKDAEKSMARVFTYKSINFAMKDSGNFIMFIPYGVPIKDTKGNLLADGIDKQYCEDNIEDKKEGVLICDAPGGMARIYNTNGISDASELRNTQPKGWNANLQVVSGEPFSLASAIRGSIASWREGDFDYDISTPFQSSLDENKDIDIGLLNDMKIDAEAPGFFNIPVCQILDLRSFPTASNKPCTACDESAAVGGTKGSKKKFWDQISEDMQGKIASSGRTCGGQGFCADVGCDFDPYTG